MHIRVKVIPNAKANQIVGWEDDPAGGRLLKVRLIAPPVDGKANKALATFLSKQLGVPKSRVIIIKGDCSRTKTLELPDGTPIPS